MEKWEGIFQSGNFEQTGKVGEFQTNVIIVFSDIQINFMLFSKRDLKFSVKETKYEKNTGNGKKNTKKVREFCQFGKV